MSERRSSAMVLGAGALWGLIVLFVHGLDALGMGSLAIVCYRNTAAALILGVYLKVRSPELLKFRLKDIWIFLGTGIVSVMMFNLCYFVTLMHTSVAVAALLLYTSPIFIMLFAFVLFHEPLTKRKLLALVITVAGCACVTGIFTEAPAVAPLFALTGLGAGLFYGLYSIFGKAALKKYRTETVTFYTFLFCALATMPFTAKECVRVTAVHPAAVLLGIGLALFCTIAPFLLYTYGLGGVSAGRAAIFATAEPMVGTVTGILVFGDPVSVWTVLGIVLILTAILIMNRPEKKPAVTGDIVES